MSSCQADPLKEDRARPTPTPQGSRMFWGTAVTEQDKGFQLCGLQVQIWADYQKR